MKSKFYSTGLMGMDMFTYIKSKLTNKYGVVTNLNSIIGETSDCLVWNQQIKIRERSNGLHTSLGNKW